jgi:hypothetical protein
VTRTELRRLLAEAAPGPWEAIARVDEGDWLVLTDEDPRGWRNDLSTMQEQDARLVAGAVNALPGLLDELDAADEHARSEVTETRQAQARRRALRIVRDYLARGGRLGFVYGAEERRLRKAIEDAILAGVR